ncbi:MULTISPECIES: hypothetical protein [unclassified Paraburkholderia]|uniref:hypothetical protein n=1 Tax=unclassified Paraburkholderia TaxID=2615204 RepID=UPI0038BCA2D9
MRHNPGFAPRAARPAAVDHQRDSPQRADRSAAYILDYATSANYAGQLTGPLAGRFVAAHFGMQAVFLITSGLMLGGTVFNGWAFSGSRAAR